MRKLLLLLLTFFLGAFFTCVGNWSSTRVRNTPQSSSFTKATPLYADKPNFGAQIEFVKCGEEDIHIWVNGTLTLSTTPIDVFIGFIHHPQHPVSEYSLIVNSKTLMFKQATSPLRSKLSRTHNSDFYLGGVLEFSNCFQHCLATERESALGTHTVIATIKSPSNEATVVFTVTVCRMSPFQP